MQEYLTVPEARRRRASQEEGPDAAAAARQRKKAEKTRPRVWRGSEQIMFEARSKEVELYRTVPYLASGTLGTSRRTINENLD